MSENEKLEALEDLFGCYFHTDWVLEYDYDTRNAISDFLKSDTEIIKTTYEELTWLLDRNLSNDELQEAFNRHVEENLFWFNGKANEFLRDIQELLADHLGISIVSREPEKAPSARAAKPPLETGYNKNKIGSDKSNARDSNSAHSASNISNFSIEEAVKNTLRALGVGVLLYPVIGFGGCLVRIVAQGSPPNPMAQPQASDAWLYFPLKSWTTEALIIPLLIVAIKFFTGLLRFNQGNSVFLIILSLFGTIGLIYAGCGSLLNFSKTSIPTAQTENKYNQAGIVGTLREVNTLNLNMRSGPGENYSVIATFPKKSRIVSYGETKNIDGALWTQASTPDGKIRGWVNRKFLSP